MRFLQTTILSFVLLWNCNEPKQQEQTAESSQFRHRSIAFHHSVIDFELVAIAAKVGFNTVELQTEHGTLMPLERLRKQADEGNYFQQFAELGMKTSLWVHELEDYQESWGPIVLDNEKLWQEVGAKYDYISKDLFPEIDHLVLTIVESKFRITDSKMLNKLIRTVHQSATNAGKKLIVRTFVWDPNELAGVTEAISNLPEDVIIHTKYVPQDWQLRSIDHPLLGDVGGHDQLVEIDLAGEYFKKRYVANVFTPDLKERYAHWQEKGVDGAVARVNRLHQDHDNSIRGELMEANLWVLGYWMQGKSEAQAWQDYVTSTFGKEVDVATMRKILEPTGAVLAEAFCVDREAFGDTRRDIAAIRTLQPEQNFRSDYYKNLAEEEQPPLDSWIQPYPDDEDYIFRNPFYRNWSIFRWDKSYTEKYHQVRKGTPEIIAAEQERYQQAQASAENSLQLLEDIKNQLPENGFRFVQWKLLENEFMLQAYNEMQLAWLKMERVKYSDDANEKSNLRAEVQAHLQKLDNLVAKKENNLLEISWLGREHTLQRGHYIDIENFVADFKTHFEPFL